MALRLTHTPSHRCLLGLSFDETIRLLSGTPTTAGMTTATYTATDAANVSASLTFTIEVTEGVILDVNGDGQVTVIDLAIVALFYGTQVPADTSLPADVNADSVVDLLDLTAVAEAINTTGGNQISVKEVELVVLIAAEQIAELEAAAGAHDADWLTGDCRVSICSSRRKKRCRRARYRSG